MIFDVIQSIKILTDGCRNFTDFLVKGLKPDREQLDHYLHRFLMLVTVLTPVIGYDRAAEIPHLSRDQELSLKEAALRLGYLSAEDFDRLVDPCKMAYPEGCPIPGSGMPLFLAAGSLSGLMGFRPGWDLCEDQVEQPPPAVYGRRGRLLYNITDLKLQSKVAQAFQPVQAQA